MNTLNVLEMTLRQLANVVYNSPCPIARQVCLDEIRRRG